MSWWVAGINKQLVTIQGASQADALAAAKQQDPNAALFAGPFPDQAGAQAWITQNGGTGFNALNPLGQTPLAQPLVPTVNPFSAVTGVADAIAKMGGVVSGFANVITDASLWRSIGWLLLGVILIFAGLWLWLKKQDVIPDVVPVPV